MVKITAGIEGMACGMCEAHINLFFYPLFFFYWIFMTVLMKCTEDYDGDMAEYDFCVCSCCFCAGVLFRRKGCLPENIEAG